MKLSARPEFKSRAIGSFAVILMIAAAYFYSPLSPSLVVGDLFLLMGAGTLFLALWIRPRPDAPEFDESQEIQDAPYSIWHYALIVAGVICLWLMAEGGGPLLDVGLYPMRSDLQFGLFWLGMTLVALGLSGFHYQTFVAKARRVSFLRGDLLIVLLITLGGLIIRAVNLENSIHLFVDEMHSAEAVTSLWANPHTPLLTPVNQITAFTWMYAYTQTFTVEIFGATLTALRVVSVIFGTLTIPATFFLARQLFDRRIALLATLLIATFPPHIHFSRLGLNNIADPLFGTLALAFLAQGLRRGGKANFALAGVALGMAQYWYEGGRLVFLATAALWIGWIVIGDYRQKRPGATVKLKHVAIFIFAAVIIAAPIYYVLEAWKAPYTPRLISVGAGGDYWLALLITGDASRQIQIYFREQLNPAFYHLFQRPDGSEFFYGGGTGLILPYLTPFFFLGACHLIWRRRLILITVILLTVLGNSLLSFTDWSARFVVAFPAMVIVIAVGAVYTWDMIVPQKFKESFLTRKRSVAALRVAIVLLACLQVVYYFGPHLKKVNLQLREFHDHQDVGWRSRDFPPGTNVILMTDELTFYPHILGMERYWKVDMNVQFIHPLQLLIRDARHLPQGGDLAFFVKPEDRESLRFLARIFDLPEPQYSPYNVPREKQYALYYIPYHAPGS